eukprot:COSAG01_NODE_1933_length_8871_cov_12.763338_3_plen_63_part_00
MAGRPDLPGRASQSQSPQQGQTGPASQIRPAGAMMAPHPALPSPHAPSGGAAVLGGVLTLPY